MRIALAVLALVPIPTLAAPSSALAGDAARIQVVFKLDPRLAGPTYGGERWISPPTYTGASAQETIEARASAVDARGRPTKARIDWSPSDPEMVTCTPPQGEQVKITVKRAGESSLTLTSGGASRKLTVQATRTNGIWQVSVRQ